MRLCFMINDDFQFENLLKRNSLKPKAMASVVWGRFFVCSFWFFVVSDLGSSYKQAPGLGSLISTNSEVLGPPADALWRQTRGEDREDRKIPENQATETGNHWPHLTQDTFMWVQVGARPTQARRGTRESDWGWTVEDSQLSKFSQGIPRSFQKAYEITLAHRTGPTDGLPVLLISSPSGFPNKQPLQVPHTSPAFDLHAATKSIILGHCSNYSPLLSNQLADLFA